MKKMLDSRFLFIVSLSLIVLIILGIGAFYLFNDEEDTFVKSGYVINPLSSKVEKYFFEADTGYKENLSSMVVFNDIDDNNVAILKDSFLHYNDGSLSFLKNGAILDLNSINGNEAVNFYNITNKSIIEKTGSKYVIKTNSSDISFKNFMGRISDDKYIVIGSLEARIPGNEKNISGDYFEIVYSESGVVNIENKDVKYQVTAEGSYIYVDNGVVIDLGNKKITSGGKDIMSITAITINGDENIEIIPEEEKKEEKPDTENTENPNEQGNTGTEDENGSGGTGKDNTVVEREESIIVSLKDASISGTSVDVVFDIYDKKENGVFDLRVTNLETGRTVYVDYALVSDEETRVDLLSPNTKYLFTVMNNTDGNIYFQKIFETNDFGIKLEKVYVTSDEIGYKVTVDRGTDITNAKLTLKKYNEETKSYEVVKTSYTDSQTGEVKYTDKVVDLNSTTGNIEGVHEIVFDGLESNTIYTAVLDEFSLMSANFKDIYNITLTSMTLKKTPQFGNMQVSKDAGEGIFKLSIDNIEDVDNAIEKYTYKIYKMENPNEMVLDPIVKTNASPIEIRIGDKENQLKNDTNYFYKLIIEYFDNEKYIEYILNDSIIFSMGKEPYVTVVADDENIGYDNFSATIYLTDNSCLIAMPGREGCLGSSTVRVYVYTVNSGGTFSYFDQVVDFEVNDDEIKYDLYVDGLQSGTSYTIYVEGVRTDNPMAGAKEIIHTERSKQVIVTKTLSNFIVDWKDKGSNPASLINLSSKFVAKDGSGTMSPEESASSIKMVRIKLYDGEYNENLQLIEPIKTVTLTNNDLNIKENFYDNAFVIKSDELFGLTVDDFREMNEDGKYTIAISAYYDESGTSEVKLDEYVTTYQVDTRYFKIVHDPEIYVDPIKKSNSAVPNNLLDSGTIVGYNVTARFNVSELLDANITPQEINFYVYNTNGQKVNYYVLDQNNNLSLVTDHFNDVLSGNDYYELAIYLDQGTEYGTIDSVMSRGNDYYIGYEIIDKSKDNEFVYPAINKNENVPAASGLYDEEVAFVKPLKEIPTVKMYLAKATEDTVKYRYVIDDPDNAIYRSDSNVAYSFYYMIGSGSENAIALNKIDGDYNKFSGDMSISNLNSGDIYSLYYKLNITKTGNYANDVINYFNAGDEGKRIFEGYYDATASKYNFKYEVINNASVDNKVKIKILADQEIIDRIINYKVKFTDLSNREIDKEVASYELYKCSSDDDVARCFTVDYNFLKQMKSSKDGPENIITVSIDALYDNGLAGYDYVIPDEYTYMIMQNNLVPSGENKYVSFSNDGTLTSWSNSIGVSKGYYTYSIGSRMITYDAQYTYPSGERYTTQFRYSLTASGYLTQHGIVNPKMISIDHMSSDRKTFSFSSITPTVSVGKTTKLINGAEASLTLTGADIDDFCEGAGTCVNRANSQFYVYVETWDDASQVGDLNATVRPTLKVKINKINTASEIKATIDLLSNASTYYYNIYTYMNNNNQSEYRQLFDTDHLNREGEYQSKTYQFTTLSSSDIYHNFEMKYIPDTEGEYNDKLMNTKINLIAYENSVAFNFDLEYVFCEYNDENCGIGGTNSNIYKSSIPMEELSTTVTDSQSITEYDLEYGKNYSVYIYAIYDYYDNDIGEVVKNTLQINRRDSAVNIKKLDDPDFIISREASYVDGDYVLDFVITVSDTDRVLDDGEYFVRLENEVGEVVGDLQVLEDGNYVTVGSNGNYTNYAFDALVLNKKVRIKGNNSNGLYENTKYTVYVYSTAYMNNYSTTIPHSDRTVDVSRDYEIYTVNTSGVAFGKDLVFTGTKNGVIITFRGGSNFDNVIDVIYTLTPWDTNTKNTLVRNGTYVIGENNKRFEILSDFDNWRFVIEPSGMDNNLGEGYDVRLAFHVNNVITGEVDYYDSITNPEFHGQAEYTNQ